MEMTCPSPYFSITQDLASSRDLARRRRRMQDSSSIQIKPTYSRIGALLSTFTLLSMIVPGPSTTCLTARPSPDAETVLRQPPRVKGATRRLRRWPTATLDPDRPPQDRGIYRGTGEDWPGCG